MKASRNSNSMVDIRSMFHTWIALSLPVPEPITGDHALDTSGSPDSASNGLVLVLDYRSTYSQPCEVAKSFSFRGTPLLVSRVESKC